MSEENKVKIEVKVPGVTEFGEVGSETFKLGILATKGFLKATCQPVLEQFGQLLSDKVQRYRIIQTIKFADKANALLVDKLSNFTIHPKIAFSIIDYASIENSDELQEVWARLYVSSLNTEPSDDSSIIFIETLKKLTVSQFRLLKYVSNSEFTSVSQFQQQYLPSKRLIEIMGVTTFERLFIEIGVLRRDELIDGPMGSYTKFGASSVDDAFTVDEMVLVTPTAYTRALFKKLNYNSL